MILEYLPSIIAWLAVLAAWGLYLLTRDAIHKAPETVRRASDPEQARQDAARDNGA